MQVLEAEAKKNLSMRHMGMMHCSYLIILHFATLYLGRLGRDDTKWGVSRLPSDFLHFPAQCIEE